MKQRIDLPVDAQCLLLDRVQQAFQQMEDNPDAAVPRPVQARLAAFKKVSARGSLTCRDAGSSLVDACGTLLHAIAIAQDDGDPPLSITANADNILITIPGGSGDASALKSICQGLSGYSGKRPDIRAQALWLARATLQRCGLSLRMSPAPGGGFNLLINKLAKLAS
jgi:hypothetical protein